MSFPPAHFLIGAATAELMDTERRLPRPQAWAVGGVLAVLPDFDVALDRVIADLPPHGTYSHSLTAAAIVALLGWAAGGRRWGVLAGAAYTSHLVVDLMDDVGPTNVMLAWPFSHAEAIGLGHIFPAVVFHRGDGVLGAALSLLEPAVLTQLALQTAVGGVFALGMLGLARVLRRGRERRSENYEG